MEISPTSFLRPGAGVAPTAAAAPIQGVRAWTQQYRQDHQQLQNMVSGDVRLESLSGAELLKLQAMTHRFSLHTELAAKVADRGQNAIKQLLQQGG